MLDKKTKKYIKQMKAKPTKVKCPKVTKKYIKRLTK